MTMAVLPMAVRGYIVASVLVLRARPGRVHPGPALLAVASRTGTAGNAARDRRARGAARAHALRRAASDRRRARGPHRAAVRGRARRTRSSASNATWTPFDTLPGGVAHVIYLLFQGLASLVFSAHHCCAARCARRDVPVRAASARGAAPGHRAAVRPARTAPACASPTWVSAQPEIELGLRQQRRRRHPWFALGQPRLAAGRRHSPWPIFRAVAGGEVPTDRPGAGLRRRGAAVGGVLLAFGAQLPAAPPWWRRWPGRRAAREAGSSRRRRPQLHPLFRRYRGWPSSSSSKCSAASADLMFRIYRFLRLRDVGDRGPFTSLQRMVEHEAPWRSTPATRASLPRASRGTNVVTLSLAYERTAGHSRGRRGHHR